MAGWGNDARGWDARGWRPTRRAGAAGVPSAGGRWTAPEIALTVVAFAVHWELGLAFLALKLWHQASGHRGSVLAFAREKWDALANTVRGLLAGISFASLHVGARSSGNLAFDAWRREELARIEAERDRLRTAEREFTAYRDELLHAKDREDFDRFMQARSGPSS